MNTPTALIAHPYPILVDALAAAATAAGFVVTRASDAAAADAALAQGPDLALVATVFAGDGAMRTIVIDDAGGPNRIALTASAERIAASIAAFAQEQSPRPGRPTPALTPRERDVARLVAAGQRNRAIAATLGISEGTVKMHLHNVYAKLGLESRTQLAMAAHTLGAR